MPVLSPPDKSARQANVERTAALALALATVFWGCGFTWAKMGGSAVYRAAGMSENAAFGPIFLLAWRFTLGAIVWLALFPAARRGWTWRGVGRCSGVGILVGGALIVQHLGLDRTPEAVSAFLTSLTILFVPLLVTLITGKPPRGVLWLGVILATLGVWLMTGATPAGFGLGEILGLLCALGFSLYILSVNAAVAVESPWRVTAGQFVIVAIMCFAACAFLPRGVASLRPAAMFHILRQREVWPNLLLLAVFPTLGAFGLLTHFQPRLDPTRAALIYLLEPLIAAAYAAVAVHHLLGKRAIAGAALILVANVLVEWICSRPKESAR
ncbi:MAG TPA: DMT family transporter [Tepidisphaeraceae bacterium]|nr:DMT family transporter [Tepidisphaeraceae bacterium]